MNFILVVLLIVLENVNMMLCGKCNGDGPDEYYDCDGNCLTDEDGDLV